MCAAVSLGVNKIAIIKELIRHGADTHKRLPARPNGQIHTLEPESKIKDVFQFGLKDTTPLEWAIKFSSMSVVQTLLEEGFEYNQFLTPKMGKSKTTDIDLILYAKAVCCCQRPKILYLLLNKGLDRTIRDQDGNTIVHMICDYVETLGPNNEPECTMECIGERSAFSLIACLEWGVVYQLRNKKGVPGMHRVLEILKCSGICEIHRMLAKQWRERIDYVEGSSLRLTAEFAALDVSDDEEELDDDESNGWLDLDSEISDDEPDLNDWSPNQCNHIFV